MSKRKFESFNNTKIKEQKVSNIDFGKIDSKLIYDEYVRHNPNILNRCSYEEILNKIWEDITLIITYANEYNIKRCSKEIFLEEVVNRYILNKCDIVESILDLIM